MQENVVITSYSIHYTKLYDWWAAGQIDQHPMLRQFVSVEHEQKILHFRELDDKVRQLTSAYIRARIRQGSVGKEDAKRNSEYGVIRRELEKKRNNFV